MNQGPLTDAALASIYREVISASIALQKDLCIGYLGPAGTFTHQAALRRFGDSVLYLPLDTIQDVFNAVNDKKVNYGVVPLENSTVGGISSTLDCFIKMPLRIRSETYLPVEQCFMSSSPSLQTIQRVYSHPEALAQCQQFIKSTLLSRNVEIISVSSTALAAQMASRDTTAGAICSKVCAGIYEGLHLLNEGVQDSQLNVTRFGVLADASDSTTGRDKTLLCLSINMKRPGSLCEALTVFKAHGISLTNMTSRPVSTNSNGQSLLWEYVFFVEFKGHAEDPNVAECMKELDAICSRVKHCGSFVDERDD